VKRYFIGLLLVSSIAEAQKLKKEDRQLVENLQGHVRYLADDKLEGRRTGTAGEKLAAAYIAKAFKDAGLAPKGTDEYFQAFSFSDGKQVNESTYFSINDEALKLEKDYFPLSFSSNTTLEALPSVALQEAGMPWFYDVAELIRENAHNPHFDLNEALYTKAGNLKNKGASAIFFYNASDIKDGIQFNPKDRLPSLNIPVVYITRQASAKYLDDASAILDLKLKTDIGEKKRTGTNVVGYIDRGAANTIVLGAHYDHLGYGEDNNSMVRNVKEIHNGADDNASGTAALLELARLLKSSKLAKNNYLFIAFSGEELGLFGSRYFVENPTIDLSKVNYMINMDMIGRLNDSSKTITVGGFGTSPAWGSAFNGGKKSKLVKGSLAFRFDSSGTGPSDHTSFYRKDIPVLFYFTGLHTDYHKPSDDFEKINYGGALQVVRHIFSLIEQQDPVGKLAFTKTREAQMTTTARFSVTMGIMPDYSYSGAGVRVDGVSKDRPAEKAGLLVGDVITSLGSFKVTSVESYMQALGKFKKGDKTQVSFQRGKENLSSTVEF
jgi:hypothetical protein